MTGDTLYHNFKQRSNKSEILRLGGIWTLNCRSMTSQVCFIGLRLGTLGGFNWNSALCSWKLSNTIRVFWQVALFSWNIPFPVRKTELLYGCNLFMFRKSVVFKICCTTSTGPRDAQENVPQNTISSLPACVWSVVHWASNRQLEDDVSWHGHRRDKWRTVIHLSSNSLPLSMAQSRSSQVQHRRSWGWNFARC